MSTTPALQDLAFYARDRFGEDGYAFEDTIQSSFDVVVDVYAHETDDDEVPAHACTALQERFHTEGSGQDVAQPDVDEFVHKTVTYLRYQYPETEEAKRDQRILSHLFWGHLVEARLAREAFRTPVPA